MQLKSLRFILLFPFLLTCFSSSGQKDQFPIDQWISSLSARQDNQSFHYLKLAYEIYELDSVSICGLMNQLRDEGPDDNPYYQIRLDLLECFTQMNFENCPGKKPSVDVLKEALKSAYEIGDEELIFQVHRSLFDEYTQILDYGSATLHALIAIELAEKLGNQQLNVGVVGWHKLGYVLYHSREYEASIKASKMALYISEAAALPLEDSLIPFYEQLPFYKMNSLNTIGLCYEKLGKPDSAFVAFEDAMKYAEWYGSDFWKGLLIGNKGDVYYQMGQYDSAEVCLKYDYSTSVAAGQFDNAANTLQWLARLELRKGNASVALGMLRVAKGYLRQMPNPTYRANTLYAYTQVFSALGKADSMNLYMQQYQTLHDSIERVANNNRLEVVRMQLDNQANVNKIISLNKEKKRIAMIRNFIIAFVVLLAITGIMILNRQKLKLKMRQLQVLEEKKKAEQEFERSKEQLNLFARSLVEKTNLVETLQGQLMHREMTTEQMERISELSRHSILTEEDWEQFKTIFEKVYPGFFHSLKQQSIDITLAELRMAALCKLQILPKEAANLLGISQNSVHKTRQRLRSRLGLDPDANLELYFSST